MSSLPASSPLRLDESPAKGAAVPQSSIRNPILRGFNPDPSVIRVGEDYFVATSTFEWFPGVRVHHSKDLVHWRLLTHPLTRKSQLDMTGVPDSGGVWAPCLTWFDGVFYLTYSVVHELNSRMKDLRNFVVTADDIEGPWSDPLPLNCQGFDPSLFHDEDGKKWLLNMVWDHRPGESQFYGIALQELCLDRGELLGEPRIIFEGTELDCTEGPHLYRRDGYYYLVTAEGGTSWDHAVTVARSKQIEGPYEVSPHHPLLTSKGTPESALQKSGHADLFETQNGEWFLAHLCSRPLPEEHCCPLGRETALQRVVWGDDGWPRLAHGENTPQQTAPAPRLPAHPWPRSPERDDFDSATLRPEYQTPRTPLESSRLSLVERPGWLRLRGGQSLASRFEQSLIARRLESFNASFRTSLDFYPTSFQQMAGLVVYYSTRLWHYACVSHDERRGRCLYLQTNDCGKITFPLGGEVVSLPDSGPIDLLADIDGPDLRFSYALGGEPTPVGDALDMSILSDDYGGDWGFTGCFVGVACQDLTGAQAPADYRFFETRDRS